MEIYVVKPGDSIWSISRRFGVPMPKLIADNGLENGILVIGQALVVIPTARQHLVNPGESLWSISRRYGVSVQAIADANNINPQAIIAPGRVIIIPAQSKQYGTIEVNAYIEPRAGAAQIPAIEEVAPHLTYLSMFSYHVREDGSLVNIPAEPLIAKAKEDRTVSLMAIANYKEGTFDTELANVILTNNAVQQTLINNIIAILKQKGYAGVNVDFERIDPSKRVLYNAFLRKLAQAMRAQGFSISTALAPKTSAGQTGAWHGAHDYEAHGNIVDFVVIMTYEWGWSGGPPMPVAPITEVEKVINYALTVIPPEKIMMGAPLYGYDWTLPYVAKGSWAKGIDPQRAIEIAARYGAVIQYDKKAEAPFFTYIDENRSQHIVWFEDARSMQAKFDLLHRKKLRGISYWALPQDFPQNWTMLEYLFYVKKLI